MSKNKQKFKAFVSRSKISVKLFSKMLLLILISIYLKIPTVKCAELQKKSIHNSEFYKDREEFIGYPQRFPIKSTPMVQGREWLETARLVAVRYGNLTEEQAAVLAKKISKMGFNTVLTDRNRYIMRLPGERYEPNETWFKHGGPPFPELLHNTKTIVDAFHKEGIRVIGHLTCSFVDKAYIDKHPECAKINVKDGKRVSNNYNAELACIMNPDFRAEYLRNLRKYIKETGVDGLMVDEIQWFGYKSCGCQSCREAIKKDIGIELPPNGKPGRWFYSKNPDFRKWLKWRASQIVKLDNEIRALLYELRPDGTYWKYLSNCSYTGQYELHGLRTYDYPDSCDMIGVESEPHGRPRLYTYYWKLIATELKYLKALMETKGKNAPPPWALLYSLSNLNHVWNFFNATSQGVLSWWLIAIPSHKVAWQPLIAWEINHERLLKKRKPIADVGIVFSALSRNLHPREHKGRSGYIWAQGCNNLCNLLFEEHIPFRVLTERDLDKGKFHGIKVLLLPSMEMMSNSTISSIRSFVNNGGTVIATGDVAMYDENGIKRVDFPLKDMFGVEFIGEAGKEQNKIVFNDDYLKSVNNIPKELTNHSLSSKTRRIDNSGLLIAEIVNSDKSTSPGILIRKFGNGTSIYSPVSLERNYEFPFWGLGEQINPGHYWKDKRNMSYRSLICSLLRNNLHAPAIKVENLPQGVLVEGHSQEYGKIKDIQVHLANFIAAEVKTGIIPKELTPPFPDVKQHLDTPGKPMKLSVLAKDVTNVYYVSPDFAKPFSLPFKKLNGYVEVTVPDLLRYAIIVFNQGDEDIVKKLNDGLPISTEIPAIVNLVVRKVEPLVGKYDPDAIVMFAGSPALKGGKYYSSQEGLPATLAYSTATPYSRVVGKFKWKNGTSSAELVVGAMDDNVSTKAPIRITVNGKEIFNGPNRFPNAKWKTISYPIPSGILKDGVNEVILENISKHGTETSPPWIGVAFFKIKISKNTKSS